MEPVTHFLFGACMGRAGLNRKTALATATLTLAAEAPDLDVLAHFRGPVFGFAHHRGFTHSFVGVPMVAAAVVAFMYLIWRIRGRKTRDPNLPPRWGILFAFSCLAGISHILLDYTTSYGIRPFWPFYELWYSWDIVFIVEPILLAIMFLGLVLPGLFSLINEEIGARRKGLPGRWGATLALIGVFAFWGLCDFEHRRAVALLNSRTYEQVDALRVSAFPYMLNPFRWYGVAEAPAFFAMMDVDTLASDVDPAGSMSIRYKPEETPVTMAAKKSYLGRVYFDWARYPVTETEEVQDSRVAYTVRFHDLRYAYPGQSGGTLSAAVRLDRNLKVVDERFGVRRTGSEQIPESPYKSKAGRSVSKLLDRCHLHAPQSYFATLR